MSSGGANREDMVEGADLPVDLDEGGSQSDTESSENRSSESCSRSPSPVPPIRPAVPVASSSPNASASNPSMTDGLSSTLQGLSPVREGRQSATPEQGQGYKGNGELEPTESSTSKQRTVREENESSRIAAAEGTEPPAVKKDVTEPGDSRPGKASAKRVLFPEEAQQDEKKPTKTRRKLPSKATRAGLVMNVSRVHNKLKEGRYAKSVRVEAAVYTAAVLEYVVAEVLEIAGKVAEFYHKKRIFPRCIQITLIGDSELNMLAGNAIIPQGGVMPHIHSALTNGVQLEPPGGKMVEFVFSEHQEPKFSEVEDKILPEKSSAMGGRTEGNEIESQEF